MSSDEAQRAGRAGGVEYHPPQDATRGQTEGAAPSPTWDNDGPLTRLEVRIPLARRLEAAGSGVVAIGRLLTGTLGAQSLKLPELSADAVRFGTETMFRRPGSLRRKLTCVRMRGHHLRWAYLVSMKAQGWALPEMETSRRRRAAGGAQ